MKYLIIAIMSLFTVNALALEDFSFSCDLAGQVITSEPGLKKAPEHPVVGLKIKVLKNDVPLYLIKATTSNGEKNLFATDWTPPTELSQEGLDLLELLSLFLGVDTTNLQGLRAALPTDLLDTFAYLELKDQSGTVRKLGFDGSTPHECQ